MSRAGWNESSFTEPPPSAQEACPLEPPLLPKGTSEETAVTDAGETKHRVAGALKRSREGASVAGLQPGQGRAQARGARWVACSNSVRLLWAGTGQPEPRPRQP